MIALRLLRPAPPGARRESAGESPESVWEAIALTTDHWEESTAATAAIVCRDLAARNPRVARKIRELGG